MSTPAGPAGQGEGAGRPARRAPGVVEPLLVAEGVTVEFNGFRALDALDITLSPGELRFVIGPNGAGKTTLIDVISGRIRPAAGRVRFRSERGWVELARLQEHQIVRLGIGRKFQTPALFPHLSVQDHLELAAGWRRRPGALLRSPRPAEVEEIRGVLRRLRLERVARCPAGALPHGQKQWLEIGMLLVQDPRLLLLDEPVAGMTLEERRVTGELLRELAAERAVLVVEHDMDFVRQFSTRVTVLHEGRLLREGTLAEVQEDRRVIDTYLGRAGRRGARDGRAAG